MNTGVMNPASSPERASEDEAALRAADRRWDQVWELLPYALTALAFAVSMIVAPPDGGRPVVAVLAVALLLWHAWFITLHPAWVEARLVPMALYFVGFVALALALAVRAEPFTLVLAGCYVLAFVALPGRWAYAGVVLTCVTLVASAGSLPPNPSFASQMVGAGALAAIIGWAVRRMESEATRRLEANAQLRTLTNRLRQSNADKDALRAQASAAAHAAGVADERARLARDFHDTLAQGLAAIGAQLESADAELTPDHPVAPRVRTALDLSRSSLVEARRSVQALRPGPLTDDGLVTALRATVELWQEQHGIPVRLEVSGPVDPGDEDVQVALLRFTQEGLANVARHSYASTATVTVSRVGDELIVDVFDDGVGFDVSALGPGDATGGFGLDGARERLAALDGSLAIESTPGEGTTVTATVRLSTRGAVPS